MTYADQSDPTLNRQFARFWRRRDNFFHTSPADLDRLADIELQHGHCAAAERLAWRAAGLRQQEGGIR